MSTATKAPAKSEKPVHSTAPARTPAQPKSSATAQANGLESIQQSAGNLSVQHLFRAGAIQAKLTISQPNDPDEQEADAVADRIMRMPEPNGAAACAACAAGSAPCPKCEGASKIHRKAQTAESAPTTENPLRQIGSGQPLNRSTRSFFESRFGADFSQVRVHTGSQASEAAQSIQAKAFTFGPNIVFGAGQFGLDNQEGKRLIAHELTHVVQEGVAGTALRVRRDPLDPANPAAWDWYGKVDSHRKAPTYLQTVGAAPGAGAALGKSLGQSGKPKTDEERDAFDQKAKTLIRLHAITMVGAHRAQLVERKHLFESMASQPATGPGQAGGSASNPKAADTANAIRAAAQAVSKLNADKEMLQRLKNDAESAVRINAGAETIKDEYQALWDSAQPRSGPAILQRARLAHDQMEGLSWGSKKIRLKDLGRDLATFRKKQIAGVNAALATLYEAFPFFADLPASTVTTGKQEMSTAKSVAFGIGLGVMAVGPLAPLAAYLAHDTFKKGEPPNDQTLLAQVQSSFDRILERTDEAIVKIGSGSMNPLDLPGAVAATRATLPPDLQAEIDRLKKEHEVWEFTKEMIMALGLAVVTGLTGGAAAVGAAAWAAGGGVALAGVGVAQVGAQLKDMLDRQTIAGASTSPEGSLLGISAPSMFEWAVFGITALLTAVDLAAVAKEVAALRPKFSEEPHLAPSRGEPKAPGKPEGGTQSGSSMDEGLEGAASKVGPETMAKADKAAKNINEHPNLIENADQPGKRRAPADPGHEIVEVPNPDGVGFHCEYHSSGGLAVPCPKGMGDGASGVSRPETKTKSLVEQAELARQHERDLPGIIEKLKVNRTAGKRPINVDALSEKEREVLGQIFPDRNVEDLMLSDLQAARGRSGAEASRLFELAEDALLKRYNLSRPHLREPTRKIIRDSTLKAPDGSGRYIDPDGVVRNPPYQYGHAYGRENRRLIIEAGEQGMTQEQFNDWVNSNPKWFRMESREYNLSHAGEKPGID